MAGIRPREPEQLLWALCRGTRPSRHRTWRVVIGGTIGLPDTAARDRFGRSGSAARPASTPRQRIFHGYAEAGGNLIDPLEPTSSANREVWSASSPRPSKTSSSSHPISAKALPPIPGPPRSATTAKRWCARSRTGSSACAPTGWTPTCLTSTAASRRLRKSRAGSTTSFAQDDNLHWPLGHPDLARRRPHQAGGGALGQA